jgi:hypothetical protein
MNEVRQRWWHTPSGVTALFFLILIATIWDALHLYATFGLSLNDFGRFYYGAQHFVDGRSLYDLSPATPVILDTGAELQLWNLGSPAFHLLFLPLTLLPAKLALAVWWLLSLLSLLWSVRTIIDTLKWRLSSADWLLVTALLLSANATAAQIVTGQMGLLIVAPITWAWVQARTGKYKTAGLVLGVLAAIKPTLLIFFPWLLMRALWKSRDSTGVIAYCASFIVTTTLALAVFGLDEHFAWFSTVRSLDWAWLPMNASIQGWATRAFSVNPMFPHALSLPALVKPLWLLCSLVIGLFTYYRIREATADVAFAILLVLALLIAPLGWLYYVFALIGPVASIWCKHSPSKLTTFIVIVSLFTPFALIAPLSINTAMTVIVGGLSMTGLLFLWAWLIRTASLPKLN